MTVLQLEKQIGDSTLYQFDVIVCFGGKEYRAIVSEAFKRFGKEDAIVFPFVEYNMLGRMSRITTAIREGAIARFLQ